MLTDTKLRNLKPRDKLYKVNDREGLYVGVALRHPALPRTKSSNAIRRCIRPRKAISGTLA